MRETVFRWQAIAALIATLMLTSSWALASSCASGNPSKICLGIKYVVYQDPSGKPVADSAIASSNIAQVNRIWAQCGIAFQIDEFVQVDPARYGLAFNTANSSDLDAIRESLEGPDNLLLVITGAWNRGGSLGQTSANAWTAMPGGAPYGSVLEAGVASYANIFAHELGHYLNLKHESATQDLMNPVIYSHSTRLTGEECVTARSAALAYWSPMIRH